MLAPSRVSTRRTATSPYWPHWPPARWSELSNTSSTLARLACLRVVVPLKITSCIDSPRNSLALLSPTTQRTPSLIFYLPQHPAHRVHDVGLAAAVGPDHAHQLPGQHEGGRFGKRLESGQLDRGKTHGSADRGGAGQAQRPGGGAGGGWTAKGG